jgi:hypothetical protein
MRLIKYRLRRPISTNSLAKMGPAIAANQRNMISLLATNPVWSLIIFVGRQQQLKPAKKAFWQTHLNKIRNSNNQNVAF